MIITMVVAIVLVIGIALVLHEQSRVAGMVILSVVALACLVVMFGHVALV